MRLAQDQVAERRLLRPASEASCEPVARAARGRELLTAFVHDRERLQDRIVDLPRERLALGEARGALTFADELIGGFLRLAGGSFEQP